MQHRMHHGRHVGRHRPPSPPRSRYAAVVTTAVVGAGVVALGSATLADQKPTDPTSLSTLDPTSPSGQGGDADRRALGDRASRNGQRTGPLPSKASVPADRWVLPVKRYELTSRYGQRWGRLHAGVDLAAPTGTPIYAAHDGVVIRSGWWGGYGRVVVIDHGNGLTTRYGHNSTLLVKEGERVRAGQQIAKMGSTGYSTGPHCHFEILLDEEAVNPIPYLRERGIDIPAQTEPVYPAA